MESNFWYFCNSDIYSGCYKINKTNNKSLLCDPNPASPANAEAAKLY